MIRQYLLTTFHSTLLLLSCLLGITISLPAKEPLPAKEAVSSSFVDNVLTKNYEELAKSIIVKVLSKDFLGTGVIVKKQDNKQIKTYTIITNNHVLTAADKPGYQIQTPDGKIYPAKVYKKAKFGKNDLGILQFKSTQNYQVTKIGNLSTVTVGDFVFAAGFTYEEPDNENSSENAQPQLKSTKGYVTVLLDKPLENGYQLGYTNDIYKGMSGGPLLNIKGELVGINGMHKNPIWEVTELYADGSEPCQAIQDFIPQNSWAITITTVGKIAHQFITIPPSNSVNKPLSSQQKNNSVVLEMQKKADMIKKCIIPKKI